MRVPKRPLGGAGGEGKHFNVGQQEAVGRDLLYGGDQVITVLWKEGKGFLTGKGQTAP